MFHILDTIAHTQLGSFEKNVLIEGQIYKLCYDFSLEIIAVIYMAYFIYENVSFC